MATAGHQGQVQQLSKPKYSQEVRGIRSKELGKDNAKKIANSIMQIVPYNINVMDTRGYIIASGDKARLNTLHLGAVHALESMEPVEIHQDSETERKGVNFPLVFGDQLMGVIGVTGEPAEVTHIGNIVAAMAKMMIEFQMLNDIAAVRESRLRDFLNDWIYLKKDGYQEEFLDRARGFGINPTAARVAAIITSRRVRFSVFDQIKRWLEPGEYVVRQSDEDALLLFTDGPRLRERIERIMGLNKDLLYCYMGEPSEIANDSVMQALRTRQTANMLDIKDTVITFDSVAMEYAIGRMELPPSVGRITEALRQSEYSKDLVDTIKAYVQYNHDQGELCKQLHIHRNTLNYRLARIEEITGCNPRRMRDLMELYTAVIHMQQAQAGPQGESLFGALFREG